MYLRKSITIYFGVLILEIIWVNYFKKKLLNMKNYIQQRINPFLNIHLTRRFENFE